VQEALARSTTAKSPRPTAKVDASEIDKALDGRPQWKKASARPPGPQNEARLPVLKEAGLGLVTPIRLPTKAALVMPMTFTAPLSRHLICCLRI
jgi:hypothetical protein